jgi:predicted acetyltransferase
VAHDHREVIVTNINVMNQANLFTLGCDKRRDANPKRIAEFSKVVQEFKEEHFDVDFGRQQLYLGSVATHPDYQRRGAGTIQCRWGLDLAEKEGLGVALFASIMGRPLYTHLGFETMAELTVQVEGEDEKVGVTAMGCYKAVREL